MSKPVTSSNHTSPNASIGVKIPCKKLTQKEEFKCEASELYKALTEKDVRKHCFIKHELIVLGDYIDGTTIVLGDHCKPTNFCVLLIFAIFTFI